MKQQKESLMEELPPAEHFRLEAAKGWVLLSDRAEAHKELDEISRPWNQHPEVGELRWYLYAEDEEWEEALKLARKLNKKFPERLFGWLAHAQSILKVSENPEAAWKALYPAFELFDGPQVPYGLACYASLAGHFKEARQWLNRATEDSEPEELEQFQATHPGIEALSEYLEKLSA
jgi:predicted Zn-dependent protease